MNNFTFYSPTLFAFGQGEASRVGALVRQFGGSKVLLVAGRVPERSGDSLVRVVGRAGQSPQRQGV